MQHACYMPCTYASLPAAVLIKRSKPKNQRVKRALEERAPKLVENEKLAMFIRGGKTSETVTQTLKDLVSLICNDMIVYSLSSPHTQYAFKKPEAVLFQR